MDQLYIYLTSNFSLANNEILDAEYVHSDDIELPENAEERTEQIAERMRWSNESACYLQVDGEHAFSPSNGVRGQHIVLSFLPFEEIPVMTHLWFIINIRTKQITQDNNRPLVPQWTRFIESICWHYNQMMVDTLDSIRVSAKKQVSTQPIGEIMLPMLEEMVKQYIYTSIFLEAREEALAEIESYYAPDGLGYQHALNDFTLRAEGSL